MITSLERKLAKYQRNLSTQRRRKGRQRIAVKERQKKARSDVMSRSSSSTSSSDSSDWKKPAQVHCCRKIEALVFLLANSMIVRQGMFFNYEKRRHARKCVIWPILGTSFSKNRHMYFSHVASLICLYRDGSCWAQKWQALRTHATQVAPQPKPSAAPKANPKFCRRSFVCTTTSHKTRTKIFDQNAFSNHQEISCDGRRCRRSRHNPG